MNAPLLDVKIKSYQEKIHNLDTLANKLPEGRQRQYHAAKQRFEQRLKAWQQTLGSDLAIFDSNVQEGYHELEAHVITSRT